MAERSLWGTRAFHLRHTLTTFNWLAAERGRAGAQKRGRQEEERREGVFKPPFFFFREVVYAQLNQGGQRWVWGDTAGLIWTIRSQVVPVPEGMCGAVSSPSLVIKSVCHPPPPRRRADPHRARRRAADQRGVDYTRGLGHNVCLISMTRQPRVIELKTTTPKHTHACALRTLPQQIERTHDNLRNPSGRRGESCCDK